MYAYEDNITGAALCDLPCTWPRAVLALGWTLGHKRCLLRLVTSKNTVHWAAAGGGVSPLCEQHVHSRDASAHQLAGAGYGGRWAARGLPPGLGLEDWMTGSCLKDRWVNTYLLLPDEEWCAPMRVQQQARCPVDGCIQTTLAAPASTGSVIVRTSQQLLSRCASATDCST